jgi:hypothetical protein
MNNFLDVAEHAASAVDLTGLRSRLSTLSSDTEGKFQPGLPMDDCHLGVVPLAGTRAIPPARPEGDAKPGWPRIHTMVPVHFIEPECWCREKSVPNCTCFERNRNAAEKKRLEEFLALGRRFVAAETSC